MRHPSHPIWAVALGVAVSLIARTAPSEDDRALVEMEPAHAALEALAPIVDGAPRAVELAIESPAEGTIFSDAPFVPLRGSLAALGQTGRVDAVVVIDTSASTGRRAERRDRVRERHRGPWRPLDPPASILEQEVRSVERMLHDVDPDKTRLGVVTFAGAPEGRTPDRGRSARTEVPLTGRLEAFDAGLQQIVRRGAAGRTDMAMGLDRAVAELTGRGASRPHRGAAKVVVFFTDGTPTLPHPGTRDNEREVFEAAERAAAAGVRVFSFAIGPEALRRPAAAAEMARRTGGVFTPVRKPVELAAAVSRSVAFEGAGGELVVRNSTLRTNARDLRILEDGVFSGTIPLRTGRNDIFVRAVAGRQTAEARRSVHYAPGSAQVFVPPGGYARPAQSPPTRLELDVTAGQRRTLEFELGGVRKELELGVGAPPPAAPAGDDSR